MVKKVTIIYNELDKNVTNEEIKTTFYERLEYTNIKNFKINVENLPDYNFDLKEPNDPN